MNFGMEQYASECTPKRIIEDLKLRDNGAVKYYLTAQFGHFGFAAFPWEKV